MCETEAVSAHILNNNNTNSNDQAMGDPSNGGSANGTDEARSSPQAESETVEAGQTGSLPRCTGTLKCFSQRLGYGFVLCDETGENLLIPGPNIVSDTNDLDLSAEWPVEFEIVEGPRGLEASGLVMLSSWPEKGDEETVEKGEEKPSSDQPAQPSQEQPEVFEYDNVQVNETNPESLLVEETEPQPQPKPPAPVVEKKSGKELGITCRVKWFNCKKWHGALIREEEGASQEPVFVRLSDEAIEAVKKRGVLILEAHQRVSVDIDWSSQGEIAANESVTDIDKEKDKKSPPFICTDLRLLEGPAAAISGDLRRDLNAAKLKETNGAVSKPGNGETLTQRQVRRRREKEQKRKRDQSETEKPITAPKKPTTGVGVGGAGVAANKPKPLTAPLGGTWRAPPKSTFGQQKSGASSLAMKRGGPPPPQMPPQQRFGPSQPMPYGSGYGMGPNRMASGGGPLSFRPPQNRGRSPPPLHPGSSYGGGVGSFYNLNNGMMPQYPPQQPQRNPYGSPQRQPPLLGGGGGGGSGLGQRSVTLPSLMGRSMSPSRGYGAGAGPGGPGPAGGNALMNLYENAMNAASRLNPYQQRDMAMAAESRSYRPQPQQPPPQQMRYFDPRSSAPSGGPFSSFGQPSRRY